MSEAGSWSFLKKKRLSEKVVLRFSSHRSGMFIEANTEKELSPVRGDIKFRGSITSAPTRA